MHLYHRAAFVASIALIGNVERDAIQSIPHTLVEPTNRDDVKRSLRQKKKILRDDHASNEERGWLSNLLVYKLNLSTISDEAIEKIMANPEAKKTAFHYLDRRSVDALKAYARLGGPDMSSTKEKFWKEYGPYYDIRNQRNY
ncbi:RxLR effector protein [Phytophthora megakarya]|uniref:RxLR effector protein n=1 Tax=Phytophthora megakarya TaxID=4795 RepID=A0A225VHY1_9STRA|nr:RxLR effector protein [Phytophthora megakarya]